MTKTYEDGINAAGNALDELYSLDEDILFKLFINCRTAEDVVSKHSIPYIIETITNWHNGNKDNNIQSHMQKDSKKEIPVNNGERFYEIFRNAPVYNTSEIDEINKNGGLKGKIVWYVANIYSGVIIVKDKKILRKVYISDLGRSHTAKNSLRKMPTLYCGDMVRFTLTEYNNNVYANDITLIGHANVSRGDIQIGNAYISRKHVIRYGLQNAIPKLSHDMKMSYSKITEELKNIGKTKDDVWYVFVRTPIREYRFFKTTSPIKGDGQVESLDDLLFKLDQEILGIKENEVFFTPEEYALRMENSKKQHDKKEKEQYKKVGCSKLIAAELLLNGFSKSETKEIIRLYGLEKKIKKGVIDIHSNFAAVAKDAIGKKKPKSRAQLDTRILWFICGTKAYLNILGYPVKQSKEMVKEWNLLERIRSNEIDVLNTSRKEVAEQIARNISK